MRKLHDFIVRTQSHEKKKRGEKQIKFIIIHYTGMQSEVEAIKKLSSRTSKVSCHYLINEEGKVFKMVAEKFIAWHAGKSGWKNFKSLNKFSIGIELVNPGHEFGYKNFKKAQILSLIKILKYLIKKYKISKYHILGHSDISPFRKKDPGEKFPWKFLYKSKIGFWHNLSQKNLILQRNKRISIKDKKFFFNLLSKIGYKINIKEKNNHKNITVAFQRRFRPESVSGLIDAECLLIAKKLNYQAKNKP